MFLQRAAIVAVVSFMFFLGTLIAFYIRQHVGYFILSTAFLVVYILTLISWLLHKRNAVSVYENGLRYRKFRAAWNEIEAVNADKTGLQIVKNKDEKVVIPPSMLGFESIVAAVRSGLEN